MMLALVTMYDARAVLSPLDGSGNAKQVTMFLPSYLPPKGGGWKMCDYKKRNFVKCLQVTRMYTFIKV